MPKIQTITVDNTQYDIEATNGVIPGGTTGQVLAKKSNSDNDLEWVNQSGGGGAVDSVNGQTGDVVLSIPSTAADVGAIAAPVSPSNGDFLVYSNGAWVAQSLSVWSGGSY